MPSALQRLPRAVSLLGSIVLGCFCTQLVYAQDTSEGAGAEIASESSEDLFGDELESESDDDLFGDDFDPPSGDARRDAEPAPETAPEGTAFDAELEAETGTRPSAGVEELLILGTATETVGQDEATSAVDFDQDTLLDIGVQDIRDLSAYTPNLSIKTAFAAVNPTIFIRGVGLDDFNANSASAVSIYMDGVYMYSPAGQLFGLYDIESIDVLRGPQPTLTNASAGAIMVRSKRPGDEFEAYLTTTLGTPSRSGLFPGYEERTFQGALNVPLATDLAVRASFKARTREGITENACGPRVKRARGVVDPAARSAILGSACTGPTGESRQGALTGPSSVEDYVNDVDNWAARILLSYLMPLPGERQIDWLLNVNAGQNRSLATQYQHTGLTRGLPFDDDGDPTTPLKSGLQSQFLAPGRLASDLAQYTELFTEGDPFAGEYDRVGPENLDLLGASLSGTLALTDTLEIESLSAWVWHDRETFANDDGGPRVWTDNDYTDQSDQLSEDLRVRWLFGDENDATLGGTFLYEKLEGNNIFRNRRQITDFAFDQDFEQRTIQWGIYGQIHLRLPALRWAPLLENVEVDGSLKYNWVEKDFSQASLAVRGFTIPANIGAENDVWDDINGDFSLTYHITEDANLYAKYSRGWKPGHFNLGTLTSGAPLTPVAPEAVDAFEVGIRTEWFDGLATANVTAFWYSYEDLQVFQTTVDENGIVLRRLINAESASIQGVEFELSAEPLEGLELGVTGAWLDTEYDEFSTSFQRNRRIPGGNPPVQTFTVDEDYSGNRLIASPEWSLTLDASWRIELGRYGWLRPWYIAAYQDTVFFGPNEGAGAEGTLVERLLEEPAYWLHNAGITYTLPSDRIEIGFWVRNFLNEEYRIQSFDLGNPSRFVLDVYGDPRTAGVTVTLRL